ncbi:MAG: tetratricopeptide repeat protein [Phaeodactylibacter sp.]|nr:tetratricopeptide repeat protein [Phaeodactylibacter sp.]MCB9051175.1 tetratricopeptide repeat protein [Lewinellaceae bacterium]
MQQIIFFLLLSLMFQFGADAQNKPIATNRSSKFTGGSTAMVRTKTKPKDKKMGLGSPVRPENIENEEVGEAFNTLEQGNWDEAIDQLDDYSENDPDAAFGLGFAYYLDGQTDKAIEAFEQMAELDPENPEALYFLGLLYAEQGNYEQAEDKFLSLLMMDPSDDGAWYELGFLYLDTEYYSDAADCFNNVLLISPEDPDAPYELARIYAISGKIRDALTALELAFSNGFSDADFVREDPDLEEVRSTERFDELMEIYFPD